MTGPGGRKRVKNKLTAQDHAIVDYPSIRDRFLTAYGTGDELEWLVEVGLYVQTSWMREENARTDGEPLDEDAVWEEWDKCSEKELRDLRTQARLLVQTQMQARRTRAFLLTTAQNLKPARELIRAATWTVKEICRGFVGALGIILMGLVFVWLAPNMTKALRNVVDDLLPEHTQPDLKKKSGEPAAGTEVTSVDQ